MKSAKFTSYILVLGAIIFGILSYVAVYNILDKSKFSNPFFSKTKMEIDASVVHMEELDDKLAITTSGNASQVCIKTTKTSPTVHSLCWVSVKNNEVIVPIYLGKTYYIWLKDSHDRIGDYVKYSS